MGEVTKLDNQETGDKAKVENAAAENRPALMSTVHMLPEDITDGDMHVGFAITVTASGKPSTIMIPDATKVNQGAPVYITGRVAINGANLKAFLADKNVVLPDAIDGLLQNTEIACEAFYYSTNIKIIEQADEASMKEKLKLDDAKWTTWKTAHTKDGKVQVDEGPLLIMFSINFNKGILTSLTGNESLGRLFDITGGSIRILRCPGNQRGKLEEYVRMLGTL